MKKTINYTVGKLDLELRMDGESVRKIEKSLGHSLKTLMVEFVQDGEDTKVKVVIPTINKMLLVLFGANKKSGVTLNKLLKEFDEAYDKEEISDDDIFKVVQDLMNDMGFSKKDKALEEEVEVTAEELI